MLSPNVLSQQIRDKISHDKILSSKGFIEQTILSVNCPCKGSIEQRVLSFNCPICDISNVIFVLNFTVLYIAYLTLQCLNELDDYISVQLQDEKYTLKIKRSIWWIFWDNFHHSSICYGTHKKCLAEALLLSTHNISFCGQIQKLFHTYHQVLFLNNSEI